jgi:hypothetical protein
MTAMARSGTAPGSRTSPACGTSLCRTSRRISSGARSWRGRQAAGVDAAARPGRGRPPLGAETAPPAHPLSAAGRLVLGGGRPRLGLAERWPWAGEITAAARMQALPSG